MFTAFRVDFFSSRSHLNFSVVGAFSMSQLCEQEVYAYSTVAHSQVMSEPTIHTVLRSFLLKSLLKRDILDASKTVDVEGVDLSFQDSNVNVRHSHRIPIGKIPRVLIFIYLIVL